MECVRCRRERAAYYKASSGEALCLRCFFRDVEERVLRTIREERMVAPGDHVAVAVSGGKDSLVLLHVMLRLWSRGRLPRDVRISAFSINEGQPYSCVVRMSRADYVRELCERHGVEYRVYTFEELFGVRAMDLFHGLWSRGEDIHACTVCGVLRRRAMNLLARRNGWTKVATGHNLDDEAQTVMMNVLMGNLDRLTWFGRYDDAEEKGLVPRIKPLRKVREEEIAVYAYYNGIPMMEQECPFVYTNPRYSLKFELARWERRMPTVKYNLYSFGRRIAERLGEAPAAYRRCRHCGEIAARDICKVCEIFQKAGYLDKYLQSITIYKH